MTLLVLWEDKLQRGKSSAQFGPLQLLAAAVTDPRVGEDGPKHEWYRGRDRLLREIRSISCGGVDKLLAQISDDRLYDGGVHVLAVYDDDQIRKHLGLSEDRRQTPGEKVTVELSRRAGVGRRFTPRPIGRNLEALIHQIASPIVGGVCTTDELDVIARKASRGQAHEQRDLILQRHSSFETRAIRERLAAASAEWRAIVDVAVAALNPSAGG